MKVLIPEDYRITDEILVGTCVEGWFEDIGSGCEFIGNFRYRRIKPIPQIAVSCVETLWHFLCIQLIFSACESSCCNIG